MNGKIEHIIIIALLIVAIWFIISKSRENFNVIEDRWTFPLTNEAGDLWIKEFDRPGYCVGPDGKFTYVKSYVDPIPINPYKDAVYEGSFETPAFNYANMPIPEVSDLKYDVEESEGDFINGPSCKRMNASEAQQKYLQFAPPERANLVQPRIEQMENIGDEMKLYVKGNSNNTSLFVIVIIIIVIALYYYYKKN
jgi:hypothetical protein